MASAVAAAATRLPLTLLRSAGQTTLISAAACRLQTRAQQTNRPVSGIAAVPNNYNFTRSTSGRINSSSRRLSSGSSDAGGGVGAVAGDVGSTLSFKTIVDGKPMTPKDFEGKAVLVVNTASLCGLTPQLKELELVYQRFRDSGLVVLGVPSNDFGGQEPWEEEKIKEFYGKDFGVTFPLTSKTIVVGSGAHPLYSAVTTEFGSDTGPQWNFHKLLVGPDGTLAGVFGSNLSPLEPDVTDAIEETLPNKT